VRCARPLPGADQLRVKHRREWLPDALVMPFSTLTETGVRESLALLTIPAG
jgi:hypothetical protein